MLAVAEAEKTLKANSKKLSFRWNLELLIYDESVGFAPRRRMREGRKESELRGYSTQVGRVNRSVGAEVKDFGLLAKTVRSSGSAR